MKRFLDISLFNTFNNTNYLFLHNNEYVSSNTNVKSLEISESIDLTIYHLIDCDCDINYNFKENVNVNITEVNHYVGSVNVNKNITLKESSNVNLVTIDKSSENSKICVNVKTIVLEKAYINNKKLAIFKSEASFLENVYLNGIKSNHESLNVFVNNSCSSQRFDLNTLHNAADSVSTMQNFGICKGKSVLDINTNGIVSRGACRSNLNQKSKGILLDQDATISANPWLQIDDYDCLASHGAGIGAIDEEELYYLMSRGLTELESSKLIINGFINPVYEEINNQELKEALIKLDIINNK